MCLPLSMPSSEFHVLFALLRPKARVTMTDPKLPCNVLLTPIFVVMR